MDVNRSFILLNILLRLEIQANMLHTLVWLFMVLGCGRAEIGAMQSTTFSGFVIPRIVSYGYSERTLSVALEGTTNYLINVYDEITISVQPQTSFQIVSQPSRQLRSCRLNNLTTTDKYLHFDSLKYRIFNHNLTEGPTIWVPGFCVTIDAKFGSECLTEIVLVFDECHLYHKILYYENGYLQNIGPLPEGIVYKQMLISGGKIFIRTQNTILIYEEKPTLRLLHQLHITVATPFVSMTMTDTGFFVYAVGNTIYLINHLDRFQLNATYILQQTVYRMAPLLYGGLMIINPGKVVQMSPLPSLLALDFRTLRNIDNIFELFTIGGDLAVVYDRPQKKFQFYPIISAPPNSLYLPTIGPPPQAIKVNQQKKSLWVLIVGHILAASAFKVTFKVLQPASLFLNEFELYSMHRHIHPYPLDQIFSKTTQISEVKSSLVATYSLPELFSSTTKTILRRKLQQSSSSTAIQNPATSQSSTEYSKDRFFLKSMKQMLMRNTLTIVVMFAALKVLHFIFICLPHRFAIIRYGDRELARQINLIMFFIALVEGNLCQGSVLTFLQIRLLFSEHWLNKVSIMLCLTMFYILVAYCLCFYPLFFRYKKFQVESILYFTKNTLSGFILHGFLTNCHKIALTFAHCFLYFDYGIQIRSIILLMGVSFLFLLVFYSGFLDRKVIACYLLSSFAVLGINVVLFLHFANKDHERLEPLFKKLLSLLMATILLFTTIKTFLCFYEIVAAVNLDWKKVNRPTQPLSTGDIVQANKKVQKKQTKRVNFIPVEQITSSKSQHGLPDEKKAKLNNKNITPKKIIIQQDDRVDAETVTYIRRVEPSSKKKINNKPKTQKDINPKSLCVVNKHPEMI